MCACMHVGCVHELKRMLQKELRKTNESKRNNLKTISQKQWDKPLFEYKDVMTAPMYACVHLCVEDKWCSKDSQMLGCHYSTCWSICMYVCKILWWRHSTCGSADVKSVVGSCCVDDSWAYGSWEDGSWVDGCCCCCIDGNIGGNCAGANKAGIWGGGKMAGNWAEESIAAKCGAMFWVTALIGADACAFSVIIRLPGVFSARACVAAGRMCCANCTFWPFVAWVRPGMCVCVCWHTYIHTYARMLRPRNAISGPDLRIFRAHFWVKPKFPSSKFLLNTP